MSKIDPELFNQIRSLCEHAGKLSQMGETDFALSKYYEALILVPDPKSDHSISTFIYTAMGEQYFANKDYAEAGKCFLKAYKCPGGENIGQINFRIGQCLEECGERKKAQDFLCQAYLLGCDDMFSRANPKYYRIIRSEVEGIPAEDDELEMIRESDDYDVIDDILRSSSSRKREGDYSGYSGSQADRDVDLYSRAASSAGQRRTHSAEESEDDYYWDDDSYDNDDRDGYFDRDDDDYDDDRDYDYDGDEDDEDGEDDVRRREESPDEGEPGLWAKIVEKVKVFFELFK